jgi:hypothetical protein
MPFRVCQQLAAWGRPASTTDSLSPSTWPGPAGGGNPFPSPSPFPSPMRAGGGGGVHLSSPTPPHRGRGRGRDGNILASFQITDIINCPLPVNGAAQRRGGSGARDSVT